MRRYGLARLLENGNGGLPRHARKIVEELIERFAALQVIKEILHRYARASKDRYPTLNPRIN